MATIPPAQTTGDLPNLIVHNIYVKDISFEAPNSPHIFTKEWRPKLDFDISMTHNKLEDKIYEVILSISVSVQILQNEKDEKGEVAFLNEIKQAGVFAVEGNLDEQQLDIILSTIAPGILFPYAREVVSSCVTKGGFPQLVLPPMNFDAMYQEHLEKQKKTN